MQNINGSRRRLSLSPNKQEISSRIIQTYTRETSPHPHLDEIPPVIRIVESPIFCFSCQQAVVEINGQACRNCIIKITNNQQKTFTDFLYLLIGVFSCVVLAVLVFNVLAKVWELLIR